MRAALLLPLTLLLPATHDEPVPVEVRVLVTPCTDGGEVTLRLACTPTERLGDLELRVATTVGIEDVATFDRELRPSPRRWEPGETVDLAETFVLPEELALEPGELVALRIGFLDAGRQRPPAVEEHLIDPDGLADLVAFEVPRFCGPAGERRLEEVLGEARELRRDDPSAAWDRLSSALRDAADDATKERVRDALIEVGRFPPAEATGVEERIVAARIRAEKVRVFRLEAGRMAWRGELHGALRLLEEVGGALALDVDEKVIGAVNDAERTTERIEDLRERLLTELTPEDEAAVAAALEEHGRTEDLLEHADELAEAGRRPAALALYRKLRRVEGIELYDRAQERLAEVGEQLLAATPSEQAAKVRAVREHPAWERTAVTRGHEFLYIGPRELVEGLPAESKLRFDLAYVFLTDLFGRLPNPKGDRLTVYFKELWDFGGGVGGGRTIDIGRADPDPDDAVRVDTGLLYHELTHCVDDTSPITGGFREGLANLGAAYAHEALDQEGDALHSFRGNLRQFEEFYLGRDLPYWRIQNYGPSAGLFLSFLERYAKLGRGRHDWTPLRRFFREYREAPVKDGRDAHVARGLATYLVRAFGPQAFDDLVRYRFPLVEADRRQLEEEREAYFLGELDVFAGAFAEQPNSPLPRDLLASSLVERAEREDLASCERLRRKLGVIADWKVIGPFFSAEADPLACVFPPELSIDLEEKPRTLRSDRANPTQRVWQDPWPSWQPVSSHRDVLLHPTGWLRFDYRPYGDDRSAIYALTHVTVPEDVEAVAHVRADDDVVLFVDHARVGSYRGRGINGSTERWRGPFLDLPDAQRFPLELSAGRHLVLVKIRNRWGPAGLALALSRPDGGPLELEADAGQPGEPGERPDVLEPRYWKRLVTVDHRSLRSKTGEAVGDFDSRSRTFAGTETDGAVLWRRWTVRPGFPKDSPSNLLWVKERITDGLEDAVRVRVLLDSTDAPKLGITVQGEGNKDGLSGWTLILVPRGRERVVARLERYDRLVVESDPVELAELEDEDAGRELVFTLWRGWVTATLDGVTLVPRVSVRPIPGRHRVGLMTWGEQPRLREVEVLGGR